MTGPSRRSFGLAAAAIVLAAAACRPDASAGPVVVSAAVSLSEALAEIVAAYERETGRRVELNLAGSDTLAAQIIAGAPVDLFVSADRAQMDRVASRGLIAAETRVDLLANQLAVVVPAGRESGVAAFDDLRSEQVRRLAVGDPDAVPAGVYARKHLESIGLWPEVRDRIVPTRDVRAVVAAVEAGHADAGIVYRTDLAAAAGLKLAALAPIDDGPAIRYPAAVVAGAAHAAPARRLLDHLRSAEAQRAFERAGFALLAGGRDSG